MDGAPLAHADHRQPGDTMHTRAPSIVALALAAGGLLGCSNPEFRPLDARRSVPTELAAASYEVEVNEKDLGDIKLWSTGAPDDTAALPAKKDRLLQVGVRIRNDSEGPMRLDLGRTELEVRTDDDRLWVIDAPLQVTGSVDIEAAKTERLELLFELPPGVKLKDVVGYELVWAMETTEGRLSRSSTFVRQRDEGGYYYRPYYAPYGGFGYGYPYGWSSGVGLGVGSSYWW
jgi:hypothetical protein